MTKIGYLTEGQKVSLSSYKNKWNEISVSTTLTDRAKAEEAVIKLYENMGFSPPDEFLWTNSSFAGFIVMNLLAMTKTGGNDLVSEITVSLIKDSLTITNNFFDKEILEFIFNSLCIPHQYLEDLIGNRMAEFIGREADAKIHSFKVDSFILEPSTEQSLMDEILNNTLHRLGISPELNFISLDELGPLCASCENISLDKGVSALRSINLWKKIRERIDFFCLGAFLYRHLAAFDFLLNECYLGIQKIKPLLDLAENVGWWWPLGKAAVLSEKPTTFSLDRHGFHHAIGKKALEYSDGWGFYAYRGLFIPEKWGKTPEAEWDPQWIFETDDLLLRRTVIEICGYKRHYKTKKLN